MSGHGFRPSDNSFFLFGPQALSFDEDAFRRLRSSLVSTSNQQWVLDTAGELPGHWNTFCRKFPHLQAIPGEQLLQDLKAWLQKGAFPAQRSLQLPNIILTPLVVITQLAQYAEYLQLCHPNLQFDDAFATSISNGETLGMCTGILSAIAVSCSTTKMQFAEHGSAAIRLAVLIGGLVDAQDAHDEDGEFRSLATVLKSHQSRLEMARILERFPKVIHFP